MRISDDQLAQVQAHIKTLVQAVPEQANIDQISFWFNPGDQTIVPKVRAMSVVANLKEGYYKIQVSRSADGQMEEVIPGLLAELSIQGRGE